MVDKDVKTIIRGHLISLNKKPQRLEKGEEYYRTKYYGLIIGQNQVSFKQGSKVNRFKFSEIKKFFLKDSCIFVFDLFDTKKRFYFKIV